MDGLQMPVCFYLWPLWHLVLRQVEPVEVEEQVDVEGVREVRRVQTAVRVALCPACLGDALQLI